MSYEHIKVLLVEDNLAHAQAIGEGLCATLDENFDLDCVSDLTTAIKRLAGGVTDLILLDLTLPDSQGWPTFERVQTAAPRVPIIVMTGLEDPEVSSRALAAGAHDYFIKGQIVPLLLARAIRYVAERKRFEAALHNSERQRRALFNRAPAAMLITDDQGRCVSANPAACALFGLPREKLETRQLAELAAKDTDWQERWLGLLAGGRAQGEFPFHRADGSAGEVEFSAATNFLPGRHLLILRDVTRHQAAPARSVRKRR